MFRERFLLGRKRGKLRELSIDALLEKLRKPEVEELGAGLGEHDVAGLQIAMHDALAMGLFQSVRDLDPVAERFLEWQGALAQSVGERLPFEVLHHQEVHARLSSDVVKRADVGMVQTGDRARFTLEALSHGDVVGEMGRQHFDGDRPIELVSSAR